MSLLVPFSLYAVTEAQEEVVATDRAHYDVLLKERIRRAAYWEEEPTAVLRGTWFYKGAKDHHYIPYPESISERLEVYTGSNAMVTPVRAVYNRIY